MTATAAIASDAHTHQFALLGQRRFAPFFWTQFAGAANDNLFKFAFTVMVTYQLQLSWMPPAMAGLAIGALFILPFLLFSATAGQLTDKYDKTRIIRFVKTLEIAIMAIAAWPVVAALLAARETKAESGAVARKRAGPSPQRAARRTTTERGVKHESG